jgi:hypothetical protein
VLWLKYINIDVKKSLESLKKSKTGIKEPELALRKRRDRRKSMLSIKDSHAIDELVQSASFTR